MHTRSLTDRIEHSEGTVCIGGVGHPFNFAFNVTHMVKGRQYSVQTVDLLHALITEMSSRNALASPFCVL